MTPRPPRFMGLLWGGWWLALAWLAAIALHKPAETVVATAIDSPRPSLQAPPPRPGFEDMQAFIAENRSISGEQWGSWLEQSQRSLAAARAWSSPNYQLKELESNLQLLLVELRKQQEAAGKEGALTWVLFRLSRGNPQLRLYELERSDAERTPPDLSRLMLRLFAPQLAAETLEPAWAAVEASCPIWGELSQALLQLQKEVEANKGRRSDLARRSLSVFEKPDLGPTIQAHARQCAAVIESRKAVATLARVLQQVEWAKVFAAPAPTALASPSEPAAVARWPQSLFSRPWMPAPLGLALACTLALAASLRMRSRQGARDWEALQEDKKALQSQLHQLRTELAQAGADRAGTSLAELPSPAPVAEIAALPPALAAELPLAPPSPIEPAPQASLRPSPRAEEMEALKATLARARQQLRNAQLGLIQGGDAHQALQELEFVQALLDQDPAQHAATQESAA